MGWLLFRYGNTPNCDKVCSILHKKKGTFFEGIARRARCARSSRLFSVSLEGWVLFSKSGLLRIYQRLQRYGYTGRGGAFRPLKRDPQGTLSENGRPPRKRPIGGNLAILGPSLKARVRNFFSPLCIDASGGIPGSWAAEGEGRKRFPFLKWNPKINMRPSPAHGYEFSQDTRRVSIAKEKDP